jgi:Ran GTPase-activating protein (RanGAP) involved in mRNA processing and transport
MENVAMSNYDVLLECVGHMQSLEELLLENAKVNRHTGNAIAAALFRNPNSLRELTLRNCTFAGSGFAIMFLGVQHLPSLTHLSIEECSMQGFASEILSATIPFLKNLKSLKLINTKLPEEGLRYLCDNLIRSSTLVELDLSQNEFDVQSMSWLVGCLQSPDTVIEKLSLNKCRLDSSSVEILSRGLSDDHKLLSMSLNNNTFGDSGAKCLVKMLKTNHNLQTLSLKGCEISKKLLKQLHNGIRYNNSFLKNVFSSEVSLAILDSFSMVEKVPETFG